MKHLLDHLKQAHVNSVKKLQQETQEYQTITKIKPAQIGKVLILRSNILKNWGDFRVIRSHIDLAFSFLTFHVGSYFENSKETPLVKYIPGIIRSENTQVQLFFVGPLKDLVKRLEDDIQEALALIASVIEIFNIDVNLRLQMLMWRLQLISVGIAVVSLVIAVLAVFK